MSRISHYNPKIAEKILRRVSEGATLRGACTEAGVQRSTVTGWVTLQPQFGAALAEARRQQIEIMADQIIQIADDVEGCTDTAVVMAARVRIDSRKWLLSKLDPSRFGDRVELLGAAGKDLFPTNPEAHIPKLLQILAVLLPDTTNSELYSLATTMASKLTPIEPPKANGADPQDD